MADSETSMSLSRPSRRDLLAAALATVGGSSFNSSAAAAPQDGDTADAAVIAWKAWRAAHRRTLALCRKHTQHPGQCRAALSIRDLTPYIGPTTEPKSVVSYRDAARL